MRRRSAVGEASSLGRVQLKSRVRAPVRHRTFRRHSQLSGWLTGSRRRRRARRRVLRQHHTAGVARVQLKKPARGPVGPRSQLAGWLAGAPRRHRAQPHRERALLEEISGLSHLHFSERARRRVQRRRLKQQIGISAWAVSVVAAAAFGLHAPSGLGLLEAAEREVLTSAEGGPPSRVNAARGDAEAVPRAPVPTYFGVAPRPDTGARPSFSPTPTPTEVATVSDDAVVQIIYDAAAEYGLGADYLLGVAQCESSLNPYAYHPAGYHGLFQFDFTTWGEQGYGDIYDPVAQARTAARLLAAGQTSRWPNCA